MIKPIWNRIVIKPKSEEETTSFWLVMSNANKEKPMQGTVVDISETAKNCPVKKWDTILYKKYVANEFKIKNEEYIILDIEDVLGIINYKL